MDEDPATGVLLLDENAIAAATAASNEHIQPVEVVERSGPLPLREVETLKKVTTIIRIVIVLGIFYNYD